VAASLAIAVGGLGSTVGARSAEGPLDGGIFEPTGSMTIGREGPTATLLGDGRVLVAGGYGGVMSGKGAFPRGTDALASAEVWDPETGDFESAGTLTVARSGQTATLLPDGRALIVGGYGSDEFLSAAEIWDAATMTSSVTGSLAVARSGARAILLAGGRVLISGGGTDDEDFDPGPEVWDPSTGTFGPGDAIPEAGYPAGTLLDDGTVLVFTDGPSGGDPDDGDVSAAILWDPATATSTPAGSLVVPRGGQFTSTVLADGRVLVTGGDDCYRRAGLCHAIDVAEIWDPTSLSFSLTDALGRPRAGHTATLLLDGRVLVVGDMLGGRADSAEVFDPG
jgi:hypothetical protein